LRGFARSFFSPLFIYLFRAALLAVLLSTCLTCRLSLCSHCPIGRHSPAARHFSTSTFFTAHLSPSACLLDSIPIFSVTRSLTIRKLFLTTVVDLFYLHITFCLPQPEELTLRCFQSHYNAVAHLLQLLHITCHSPNSHPHFFDLQCLQLHYQIHTFHCGVSRTFFRSVISTTTAINAVPTGTNTSIAIKTTICIVKFISIIRIFT